MKNSLKLYVVEAKYRSVGNGILNNRLYVGSSKKEVCRDYLIETNRSSTATLLDENPDLSNFESYGETPTRMTSVNVIDEEKFVQTYGSNIINF